MATHDQTNNGGLSMVGRRRGTYSSIGTMPSLPDNNYQTAEVNTSDNNYMGERRRRRGGTCIVATNSSMPTLGLEADNRRPPTNNNLGNSVVGRRRGGTLVATAGTNLPNDTTNTNINNINTSNVRSGTQRNARYTRDADCSCASCTLRLSGSAEIKKWQFSDAKAHLHDLLSNNKQHNYWNDPPAMVYDDNRDIFHLYKYENFCNNIRSLKKAITSEQDNVDFDEVALERENIAFPRAPLTSHNNPFYDTSETKKILVGLAKEGKLEQYKHHPSTLMETNPIFDEYSKKVFAKAVNREKRRVKEVAGWQLKRNIQGSKKNNAKYDKV